MNYARIANSISVPVMHRKHVVAVGGAYQLAADLVRSGLGAVTLVDFGRVDATNAARQDLPHAPGRLKIDAAAEAVQTIGSGASITTVARDVCSLRPEEVERFLGGADLIVGAADSFPAQARCHQIAIARGIPFMGIGLYEGGRCGEVVYTIPGVTRCCARCIWRTRYRAFAEGTAEVTSQGGTILDLRLIDAVAGHIAVGILTRGEDNRFGRLVEALDCRNLVLVKTDPSFRLGDPDLFTSRLGTDPANIAFSTIALRIGADPDCPDCALAPRGSAS